MRNLMMIAFTMFSLAGCLDEAPAADGDETATDETAERRYPEGDIPEPPEPKHEDKITGDELGTAPHETARCVVSDDCVLADPDTEYRMCDRESGTCIRNPLPF